MIDKNKKKTYDFLIIGGGFYGCCLALYLSQYSEKIIIIEQEKEILKRSSKINQARVHTGFHYPRSALTAVKSLFLKDKFKKDFSKAVIDDFQMLYAISKNNSKVNSNRFFKMFKEMGAPIKAASENFKSLFNSEYIEDVFECEEYAFDYFIIRDILKNMLEMKGIKIHFQKTVDRIFDGNYPTVEIKNFSSIQAKFIFNITYGNINNILNISGLKPVNVKNELVELALLQPPSLIKDIAVTVMDGPFFSAMPFPHQKLYSLSHVRHSVHQTWFYNENKKMPYDNLSALNNKSKFIFMLKDAIRYLPCMEDSKYEFSLFEYKSVLMKNEYNDGRPILYSKRGENGNIINILGGKLDNIYDLYNIVDMEVFANYKK